MRFAVRTISTSTKAARACAGIVALAKNRPFSVEPHLEASNCLIFLLAIFERAAGLTNKMRERDNAVLTPSSEAKESLNLISGALLPASERAAQKNAPTGARSCWRRKRSSPTRVRRSVAFPLSQSAACVANFLLGCMRSIAPLCDKRTTETQSGVSAVDGLEFQTETLPVHP